MTRHTSRQSGFSLIELMIALVLGLILTAGVISVYMTSKKTYALNVGIGQVQESGRFALGFMEEPIRMAGFMGCWHGSTLHNTLTNGTTTATLNLAYGVQGYEANGTGIGSSYTLTALNMTATSNTTSWTPSLPSDISAAISGTGTGKVIAGNDILVVLEGSNNSYPLTSPNEDSSGLYLASADATKFTAGELAIAADCTKASLFQVKLVNSGTGLVGTQTDWTSGGSAAVLYSTGARLLPYTAYVFYIGVGVDGGPSLYEATIGSSTTNGALGVPQELVSGVENMQILYGVDTSNPIDKIPNNFETAATVNSSGNWGNVVSVRIGLLTRSDDNSLDTGAKPTAAPSFVLLGISSTDTTNGVQITSLLDRRLRKTFAETISVRNLLP